MEEKFEFLFRIFKEFRLKATITVSTDLIDKDFEST